MMEIPLQITTRNIDLPESLEEEIRQKARKLDNVFDRIVRCRVVLYVPPRHSQEGPLYNVRIDMTVPGAELVVKREPHEDIEVAIRDAFDAARRKLEDYAKRLRGDVKQRAET